MFDAESSLLARISLRRCNRTECWFPEAFAGTVPIAVIPTFGGGFRKLIQVSFILIGGYLMPGSPSMTRLRRVAALPRTGRCAVGMMLTYHPPGITQ